MHLDACTNVCEVPGRVEAQVGIGSVLPVSCADTGLFEIRAPPGERLNSEFLQ